MMTLLCVLGLALSKWPPLGFTSKRFGSRAAEKILSCCQKGTTLSRFPASIKNGRGESLETAVSVLTSIMPPPKRLLNSLSMLARKRKGGRNMLLMMWRDISRMLTKGLSATTALMRSSVAATMVAIAVGVVVGRAVSLMLTNRPKISPRHALNAD